MREHERVQHCDPCFLGIDLGTSNTTATLWDRNSLAPVVVDQQDARGQKVRSQLLPSCLYFYSNEEQELYQTSNMQNVPQAIAGLGAKERLAVSPERGVVSAKSWLSVSARSAEEPFLPLHSEDTAERVSPLIASARYLEEMKKAGMNLVLQSESFQTVITIPASFNERARQLTEHAAVLAGLASPVLLEEPLAAFYYWLYEHRNDWREYLQPEDSVLVVDIGGGTTDFSIIKAEEHQGELILKRTHVGPHLLLGGDNMDLLLAYTLQDKLESTGAPLDQWQFLSLISSARNAKELLLSEDNTLSATNISLTGRSASLFDTVRQTTLTSEELSQVILEGFFPFCDINEKPFVEQNNSLEEFGLPYAQDAAITRHLGQFLSNTLEAGSVLPNKLLLNGGVCKSPVLAKRIIEQLQNWCGGSGLSLLPADSLDFAVSRGAALCQSAEFRSLFTITAGLSRNYYIGVKSSRPAIPGRTPETLGVCVAYRDMPSEELFTLEKRPFFAVIGTPMRLEIFESEDQHAATLAEQISNTKLLKRVGVVHTELAPQSDLEVGARVQVYLSTQFLPEKGLEITLTSSEHEARWVLSFAM